MGLADMTKLVLAIGVLFLMGHQSDSPSPFAVCHGMRFQHSQWDAQCAVVCSRVSFLDFGEGGAYRTSDDYSCIFRLYWRQ